MGYYVNPPSGWTKERWLRQYGQRVSDVPTFDDSKKTLPVCLVDNGAFTAAGVAYSQRELEAFNRPNDNRPKEWYVVPTEMLLVIIPDLQREL